MPSLPGSYISAAPLGAAKRMFIASWRAAMLGFMPSNTRRPALVLVEAEVQEAAQVVARLRVALRDGVAHASRRAGWPASPLPQEGDQIARGREADAVHRRILGDVGQLVERRRIEAALEAQLLRIGRARETASACSRQTPIRRRAAGTRLPSSDSRRVSVALAVSRLAGVAVPVTRPRMIGCVVGAGGRVGEARHHRAGDARAVGVLRDRRRPSSRCRRPARMSACQPLATSTCPRGAEVGEVGAALDVGAAAVRHLVDQHAGGLAHVHRLQDGERGRVLDHAARVARRELDVGDDGVERVLADPARRRSARSASRRAGPGWRTADASPPSA